MKSGMSVRLAGLVVLASSLATAASGAATTCCFSNPAYAGTCEVTLAQGEDCDAVLAYLNNPMSSGKSYCNVTTIRGGWRAVTCSVPPSDQKTAPSDGSNPPTRR